ncbi:OmpA family protein [Psychrobacter sp. Sarcosine-3u-12]|uniref:OmpA family protein n=1 Tax=Psychrobacter sp. Sarcosine-3u-12 TaxID=2058325 RepID=UPI000C349374|nr:OmpA family protein [Psychrobacter sp. Sarcosine-3u-12]PKG35528.1 OmpA family protein [Psychrobacter sp. Sarcosine-3u-12]
MIIKPRNTFLVLVSASLLTGCQTADLSNQATQIIDIPVVEAILDSDGDGYSDDIDMCPGTPRNVVTDERGCPFTGMGIGLKMEYRAFFAKGSSELSPEYQLELDKVAAKLQEYYTATMRIEGHATTNEISATDTALQPNSLARNRALIVKNYLIMQHQIDPNRLSAFGFGAEQPIASSDTEEGKSMNRRVYGVATADFDTEEEMSMHRRVTSITMEPED